MPKFQVSEQVRVLRTVRNDGTFPGKEIGDKLVLRGAVGYVKDVGTYLQDQTIYAVHFFDDQVMVGCREEELQLATDPWNPSRFEFRDKVTPRIPLAIAGEVIAEPGTEAEILKVLRDAPGGVAYHVRIPGRTLQVPETALDWLSLPDDED